ncbi:hypothetical protein COD88_14955 [Bacillus cereus]|nr:hypothetical protein COD88_14955 [Bacillus cereus]
MLFFPAHTHHQNKKKLPSRQLLPYIPHLVIAGIYQRFFKYIDRFSTYINDFFRYINTSTLKALNIPIPIPQAIYCRTLRLKR